VSYFPILHRKDDKMAGKDVADMQHHLAETPANHVPERHHRMAEKERNQALIILVDFHLFN
jgi:hypothetical protein